LIERLVLPALRSRRQAIGQAVRLPVILLIGSAAGPAFAQDLRKTLEYFWPQSSSRVNVVASLAILFITLILLVAYLIHLVTNQREVERARRSLATDLDRLLGSCRLPPIDPGDHVELEVEGPRTQRLYHSLVQDVQGNSLVLAAPVEEGVIVPLRVGQSLSVVLRRKPYSYRFRTRVLRRKTGEIPTLTVDLRSKALRFQRREFVRVPVELEAQLVLRQTLEPTRRAPSQIRATVCDLSGSGLRLETDVRIVKVRFLTGTFAIPDGKKGPIVAECQVIPTTVEHNGVLGGSSFGAQFIEVSNAHRERVVAYVLAVERKHRRREADAQADAEMKAEAPGQTAEPPRR